MWATSSSTVIGGPQEELVADIGMIAPDNFVRAIIREEDIWNYVVHYAEGILSVKKGKLECL